MKDEKDWSKATDEERLEKARIDYKTRVVFRCAHPLFPQNIRVSHGDPEIVWDGIRINGHSPSKPEATHSNYIYYRGNWAEIISKPKEETDHEGQPIKYFGGLEEKNRPEPKAGDMVEVKDNEEGDYPGASWKYHGIKNKKGHFICEDHEGFVCSWQYIRLPQKSEVESKAKELHKLMPALSADEYGNKAYTDSGMVKYGIDCIKWGQQNPTKI